MTASVPGIHRKLNALLSSHQSFQSMITTLHPFSTLVYVRAFLKSLILPTVCFNFIPGIRIRVLPSICFEGHSSARVPELFGLFLACNFLFLILSVGVSVLFFSSWLFSWQSPFLKALKVDDVELYYVAPSMWPQKRPFWVFLSNSSHSGLLNCRTRRKQIWKGAQSLKSREAFCVF